MFKIKLENCKLLKEIIDVLDTMIGTSLFIVNKNEFRLLAMDPSRISIFRMVLKKSTFSKFELDEKTTIAIDLFDLNKIFRRIDAGTSVELIFDGKDNRLQIIAEKKKVARKRTFKLSTMDLPYSEENIDLTKIFAHESKSSMVFTPEDFYLFEDAVKDGMIYSEKLTIKTEPKKILFYSYGNAGEMEYEIIPDELTDYTLEKCQCSYSLTFLNNIIKLKSVGTLIDIQIDDDYPLKMIIELGNGNGIIVMLGPLVDTEDLDDFEDDINMEPF
jgi:proliferating cell nuclear antigen